MFGAKKQFNKWKDHKFTTTKVVCSNMMSQMSLGKSSNKRKTHKNSNGKSSSRKTREVQNIVAKKIEFKKRKTQNILFSKKISFNPMI